MTGADLARALGALSARMPMVVNDLPVVEIAVASGRIRRDVMGDAFAEMHDKPRDDAIVLRPGAGTPITVRDAVSFLASPEHADLPVFVHGGAVDGIETVQRRHDPASGRFPAVRGDRIADRMATPVHWSELSTGEQALSQVWTQTS